MGAPAEMTPEVMQRLIFGPGPLSPARVRARNIARLMQIIVLCDKGTEESARARELGDVFVNIREWAESGIWEIVERAGMVPPIDLSHDPVKDACHDATAAAIKGDAVAYAAARQREAAARAARAVPA